MAEKRIIQTEDGPLEIEEKGQSIGLPDSNNMQNGVEIIPEDDGGVTLDFDPNQPQAEQTDFTSNIAEFLDDDLLSKISSDLQSNFEDDKNSRSDWENTY